MPCEPVDKSEGEICEPAGSSGRLQSSPGRNAFPEIHKKEYAEKDEWPNQDFMTNDEPAHKRTCARIYSRIVRM